VPGPADRTLRHLLTRAVELDVATPEATAAVAAWASALLDTPLGAGGASAGQDLAEWLVALQVAYRLPVDDDADDLEEGYRGALETIAACTRGRHRVDGVSLAGGTLRFALDGALHEREVDDVGDQHLDTLALFEELDRFVDEGRRTRWSVLVAEGEELPDVYVLGVPDAVRALVGEFGCGAAVAL